MKVKKAVIFDAGPLINFSINGFLYLLPKLKENFNGEFIVPHAVKKEIIGKPINNPRFELSALRLQKLFKDKILKIPEDLGLDHGQIEKKTNTLLKEANHLIKVEGRWSEIVSEGEVSCLAVSSMLSKKNIKNIIAIDERTTRLLSEKPEDLEETISRKVNKKATLANKNLSSFSEFKFMRSSELIYVAYKKGLLNIEDKKSLEAALYATKFKGASISFDEIKQMKKLA